jgi:uncharacterized protein (DUF1330 family)
MAQWCGRHAARVTWRKNPEADRLPRCPLSSAQLRRRMVSRNVGIREKAHGRGTGEWPDGKRQPICFQSEGIKMPAYIIANIEVTDPAGYEEYKKLVGSTIAAYGGRYLTRGGATEVLEGDWVPKRVVILEFPSMAQIKAWYASPEYQPALKIRQRTARGSLVATEGL